MFEPRNETVAGCSASAIVKSLLRVLPQEQVLRSLLEWLVEDEHFLKRAGLVIAFSTSEHEEMIVSYLSSGIQALRASLAERSMRYAHHENEALQEAEKQWRKLVSDNKRFPLAAKLVPLLDSLSNTPLHSYREMTTLATRLAAILQEALPTHAKTLEPYCRLLHLHRTHVAALRYTARKLPPSLRSVFFGLLRGIDSGVADTVAKAVPDLANEAKGLIFDPASSAEMAYDPESRIWPKNNAIVTILAAPLVAAQTAFGRFLRSDPRSDEDRLSERLVTTLFEQLNKNENIADVQAWIRNMGLYGGLSLSEPYIRHREPEMGADIAFVVKYDVSDILKHTWTYLFQAKKAKDEVSHPTRWDIDRVQLNDLVLSTRAGYYLLYTAEEDSQYCYVMPAETVHSTLHTASHTRRSGKTAKSIPYNSGKALGKPWSLFLLEDIFGAWGGDPNEELAKLAIEGRVAPVAFELRFSGTTG
jgi:exonuclease VII small subunit